MTQYSRYFGLLISILIFIVILEASIVVGKGYFNPEVTFGRPFITASPSIGSKEAEVHSHFFYGFETESLLPESGKMNESWSPYFWVNSGALLIIENGVGRTIKGTLPVSSPWVASYAQLYGVDTLNGTQPQNVFRLLTRKEWEVFQQQIYVRITDIHTPKSPNVNTSNGIFLYSRFQNGDNTYYAGIRVDGALVIKKKYNGDYYTLAEKQIYPYPPGKDASSIRNLIPLRKWIGLKTIITTNAIGTVSIKLFIDLENNGVWASVLEAADDGKSYGGNAIVVPGYAGIRTDFMDVEFDNYKILGI